MDISLITSLYRAERFLPDYIRRVQQVADTLRNAGVSIEICMIANDVTIAERNMLEDFAAQSDYAVVRILAVPRESLYASWNRGMEMATGKVIGIWNVDDIRMAAALVEGYKRIVHGGCQIIDFPFTERDLRGWRVQETVFRACRDKTVPLRLNRALLGPFFMFSQKLYEQIGPFDSNFKSAGDFEWQVRASQVTTCCEGQSNAGIFQVHGGNISRGAANHINYDIVAEDNMVYLLHDAHDHLRFTDPAVMLRVAQRWDDVYIPADVADRLWGEGVQQRFRRWQRRQQIIRYFEPLRPLAKSVINRLRLRSVLARFGIVLDEPFALPHQIRK